MIDIWRWLERKITTSYIGDRTLESVASNTIEGFNLDSERFFNQQNLFDRMDILEGRSQSIVNRVLSSVSQRDLPKEDGVSGGFVGWTIGQIEVGFPLESLDGESGFLGGGLTVGVNSYGQLFITGFYTMTAGLGAVAAVTGGPVGGLQTEPLPSGASSAEQWYRGLAVGVGSGGSASVSGSNQPFSVSGGAGSARGGMVIGVSDGTGTINSGTLATPAWIDPFGTLGR
jgi:hypothetical protein